MEETTENRTNKVTGVKKFGQSMVTNTGAVGEIMQFLWARKLWWMIPMVMVLLMVGLLLFCSTASGVAPFIYTLI